MEMLQKLGFGFGGGKAKERGRAGTSGRHAGAQPTEPVREGRSSKGETVGQRRRMALRPPSFTDLLPYVAYDAQEKVFVLKDGSTLGLASKGVYSGTVEAGKAQSGLQVGIRHAF